MDRMQKIYELHHLLNGRRTVVSISEIMTSLGCSRATAFRTMAELRDYLQAPIEYDHEFQGYRYVHEKYELPGIWFSAREIIALLTFQKALSELGSGLLDRQFGPIRDKISQLLQTQQWGGGELRRIKIIAIAARIPNENIFMQVAEAVIERKQIRIMYFSRSGGTVTERTVSPQRMVHYRDNWYLDAWCHERNQIRVFSVDGIRAAEIVSSTAIELQDTELNDYLAGGYGIFSGAATHTAIIKFSPHRARWVADECWHPQQQGKWLETGEYELHIPYADSRELAMDILRHVPEVDVVAPEELRKEIRARLKAGLEQFDAEQ